MRAARWLTLLPLLAAAAVPAALRAQAVESRTYTPGPFDGIEISGSAQVRFTQGQPEQVVVEGGDDVQRSMRLEVSGGVLQIRPSGSWKFWNNQRLQLHVTARELRKLTISGAADLVASGPVQVEQLAVHISGAGQARFDQIKAVRVDFHASGAGDGHFAGQADELRLQVSGRGNFNGQQLQTQQAQVAISGIGNVQLWVLQDLRVAVSGIGTVDHWGGARVQRSASGIARVNDRGPRPPPP